MLYNYSKDAIDTEIKAKRNNMTSKLSTFRNESKSKSEIQGEVSMWTWMRMIVCPSKYQYVSESDKIFGGEMLSL